MKIDPNQLVGGFSQTLRTYTEADGQTEHIAEHVGGVPLRLEIAARVYPHLRTNSDFNHHTDIGIAGRSLEMADALIVAHNATAGEVAGG